MEANTIVEELLKPRYKVIAEYTSMAKWKIGDIIIPIVGNFANPIEVEQMLSKYPHLFRKLEWWEDRKPEEMPSFLKDIGDGQIYKVSKYEDKRMVTIIANKGYNDLRYTSIHHFVPSTYEDFTKQQSSKK